MEVMGPIQDFHFDSSSTSPYVSAPSSPRRRSGDPFAYFFDCASSAPTSPTRAAAIYAHFNAPGFSSPSAVPFAWEDKPGSPKPTAADEDAASAVDEDGEFDFAFDFSGQLQKGGMPPALTAADELFEEGKIRPLKPPPRLYQPPTDDRGGAPPSPRSPRASRWSPRGRGRDDGQDPFAVAMERATRERGRESSAAVFSSSRSRKGSRSLSPLRSGAGWLFPKSPTASAAASPLASKGGGGGGSRKWRLRDLLLFRSASEGRVTGGKSKYTLLRTPEKRGAGGEDSRNSSFRSTASSGSSRRAAAVSPHEVHYAARRAAAEELRKKTPLPYRQGLFGCLRFNPAVNSIAKGFGDHSFAHRRS